MHGHFVVEGEKLVGELLRDQPDAVAQIYALESWTPVHLSTSIPLARISNKELERLSSLKSPNQVLAKVRIAPPAASIPAFNPGLYLESIQDPGNLGTILRIADWFGIPEIFCSPDTVEVYNPKVIQASMGAIFRVAVHVLALEELLAKYPEIPLWGTTLDGQNVFEHPLEGPLILAIGNESQGLSPTLLNKAQGSVRIPGGGQAESLNAGVATGILTALYRQQQP